MGSPPLRNVRALPTLLCVAVTLSGCGGGGSNNANPAQGSSGSATLTWTMPVTNDDGTSLMTFAGYRIVYGTSANSLTQTAQIANPAAATYTVTGLTSGTWYFAVKTYLADGTESAPSNPVTKVVP